MSVTAGITSVPIPDWRTNLSRFWSFILTVIGEIIPVILLVVVTVVIAADLVGRSVFVTPVPGARDIGLIAFIWMVYLGLVGVARDNQMMGISFFRDRLVRTRRFFIALAHLLIVAIAGYVVYATYRQISTARFTVFDQLPLPKWILAVSVGIGMMLVIVIHAARAVNAVRGLREEPSDGFGSQSADGGGRP